MRIPPPTATANDVAAAFTAPARSCRPNRDGASPEGESAGIGESDIARLNPDPGRNPVVFFRWPEGGDAPAAIVGAIMAHRRAPSTSGAARRAARARACRPRGNASRSARFSQPRASCGLRASISASSGSHARALASHAGVSMTAWRLPMRASASRALAAPIERWTLPACVSMCSSNAAPCSLTQALASGSLAESYHARARFFTIMARAGNDCQPPM